MQLETITMPRAEARKAYLEYRNAIRETHKEDMDALKAQQLEQDQIVARAYKQLSVGNQLIRLSDTILGAGFDDQYRPRMAIVRADYDEVYMRRWRGGALQYEPSAERHRVYARSKLIEFMAPVDDRLDWSVEAVATTPSIPPPFRPKHHLRNYHLLWEATWRKLRSSKRAPRDPALVKHLGGELWAVLAIWDLTDVERAALETGQV